MRAADRHMSGQRQDTISDGWICLPPYRLELRLASFVFRPASKRDGHQAVIFSASFPPSTAPTSGKAVW